MSMAQIIILGVGVLIVLTSVDFSSLLSSAKNVIPKPKTKPITPTNPVITIIEDKDDLVNVVKKWDDLKNTCESLGLKDAVVKLDEIFPMLIKVDK